MKTLYKIGMLAVAALAFVGCSKEVDVQKEKTTGTHTLTFKVQKDIDTKTAVVEGDGVASYVWTAKDDQYFHIYENGAEATEISMELSSDNTIATFKATFANTGATKFTYRATYGSDLANSSPHNPRIPSEQAPLLGSFDPAADVLVSAEDIVLEGNAAADENTEFLFKLKRVVSVNKMTLKGLAEGEIVKRVVLRSTDAYLSSRYMINDASYTGEARELVFDYSELENATVGADGTFPVYFTAAPVSGASFSVSVTTDKNVYTRDDFTSKLTLAVGTFRRFGINLSEYGSPIQAPTTYKLVEDNESLVGGAEFLIVAKDKNKAAGAYFVGSTPYLMSEDISVSEKKVSITAEPVQVFTLEEGTTAGQFYIKDADGKYLAWSTGNSVTQSDTKYLWTVTKDGITSVATSTRALKYNSGSPRFACYTSGQTDIELYVNEVELEDPQLSFSGEATIEVEWDDKDSFVAPTLTKPAGLTATYSSSDEKVATVDENSGEITFVGNGTTVITAATPKTETYRASSVSYTLVVSGAPVAKGEGPENPFTAAEVVEFVNGLTEEDLPTDKEYYIAGTISRIPSGGEFGTQYGNATFYISEGDVEFEAYRVLYVGNRKWTSSDPQISVGDEVLICGRLTVYNGTIETYAATGTNAYNGYLVSHTKAPYFTAEVTENTIAYTGGSSIILKVEANVAWTAAIDNGATLKIGDGAAAASVSGTADTDVTVIIPENVNGATYTISFSTTSDAVSAPKDIEIVQTDNNVQAKEYSFTISTADFNSTSYAANNTEKTSTATATDGSGATVDVRWTSNQVMLQSGVMQWQSGKGYIYNSTDLGTISSVTINSSAGSFTTYYGTSAQPSSNTTVGDGFFQIKVGGATGKTSSVVVVFTK